VVNYDAGSMFEKVIGQLEEQGAKLNYQLYDKIYELSSEYIAGRSDMGVRRLYKYYFNMCWKRNRDDGILWVCGLYKNLVRTWTVTYSDECHVLENYRELGINEVYFKLNIDNLYKMKSYGNCSLNSSNIIKHLIYFTPEYKSLSEELQREYMDNLKYYYMSSMRGYQTKEKMIWRYKYEKIKEDSYFQRFTERVVWVCIEKNIDTTIKVTSNISMFPLLAIILKNRGYIEMSGVFSRECRKGVYHGLVELIRELPEYKDVHECGVSYKIVQPVIEMYLLGYSQSEMLIVYEGLYDYSSSLSDIERNLMIERILMKANEVMPELRLLMKFMRRYVDYRVKKYGYISSNIEDSRIEYYYKNGVKEGMSKGIMRKRILGDRMKLLNNKIMYNCVKKMVNKSVSNNCYIEENAYIIHPCDLNNLMAYYNEEIVKLKNMSLWEIMCDAEIKDENSEFYKANRRIIEKLNKVIENKSVIEDSEILGSKYTIVPYNPDREFERLKGYPGTGWWYE
jgi:hypothetical protein